MSGDARAGRGAIRFAAEHMPALKAMTEHVTAAARLRGMRVGVALMLEPKTACLVEAIAAAGGEVTVLGNAFSTKPDTAAALRDAGIEVHVDGQAERPAIEGFLDSKPQLIVDDGAVVSRHVHRHRRDVLPTLVGVAEETTSGVRPLRTMDAAGELEVACIAVNDARTKVWFDNVYGTGQSVVMAVLDVTNIQMPGSRVVVVGYGWVGRGIAAAARALGGLVEVAEIDPVRALVAFHDGFSVRRVADSLPGADIVITATGVEQSLTGEHVEMMRDGSVVAVGGAGRWEFDYRVGSQIVAGDEVRNHVRALTAAAGHTVYLVADGHCANTTAGEGNPIEIMDLSLALQLRALDILAAGDLPPGVHLLPHHVEDEVAAAQLAAAGIHLDTPGALQRRAAEQW